MKLLVTGLTGHTGKWFLEAINEKGFNGEIHAIVRKTSNTESIDKSIHPIKKHIGDLTDKEFLNEVCKDIDVILHIASINNSLDILDAAVKNGVEWFIGVHTTGMFSEFKIASEGYINIEKIIKNQYANKIDITILRPTMIYGSSMDHNMFKLIKFVDKSPLFPVFGNGKNLMQPVYAKDLGYAYYNVISMSEKTKNKEYNLSGKNAIKYKDLVKTVAQELQTKIIFVHIPIIFSYNLARLFEKVPGFPINSEQVLRMKEDKKFGHINARKDFSFNPVSFEEGIKFEVAEYLEGKK
ncbi:NAD(P)-dependent oxidoreductase [Macrococcus capreoli]